MLLHDDISIDFPNTINVNEHKAPTDESIRLLNEMQEKTIDNIVSKIEVKDNLVEGQIYVIDMLRTTAQNQYRIICKFKINQQEFVVDKEIDRWELQNAEMIYQLNQLVLDYGKSVMLWFALKQFVIVAYKQILNSEPPAYVLKNFMETGNLKK